MLTGDFNGDGKTDIGGWNDPAAAWHVARPSSAIPWEILVAGDVDYAAGERQGSLRPKRGQEFELLRNYVDA
jgi:hypothetical protein